MAIKMEEIFQFHQGLSGFFKARTAKSAGVLSFNSIKDYLILIYLANRGCLTLAFNSIKDYQAYHRSLAITTAGVTFQFHQGLSQHQQKFHAEPS